MEDLDLTTFDVAVLLLIGISAFLALVRGATREALTMAAWVGALAVTYYGYGYVRVFARQTIETGWIADAVALAVVFLVPLIVFKALASALADQMAERGFGAADRLVGAAFGAIRGGAIICALYLGFVIIMGPDARPSWVTEAKLLPYIEEGAAVLEDLLPADAEETGRRVAGEVVRELSSP